MNYCLSDLIKGEKNAQINFDLLSNLYQLHQAELFEQNLPPNCSSFLSFAYFRVGEKRYLITAIRQTLY